MEQEDIITASTQHKQVPSDIFGIPGLKKEEEEKKKAYNLTAQVGSMTRLSTGASAQVDGWEVQTCIG